jgi:F420-dependent oxidoreductase-like protein
MCAQTIDDMAGGNRMIVGLGVSGPQIVEGWYGQPWGKPAARLRDYVAIMKKILQRQGPVTHEGAEITLPYKGPGSSGLGKPLKSILHGNPNIPIVLGTSTPGNIRMTAEISDGWLSMSWYPGAMKLYGPMLEQGLAKRSDGKTLKNFDITAVISISMTGDVQQALAALKPHVALYVGGMGAKDKNFHKDKMIAAGFPEAADRIQELYLAGRKDEAAQAVPDDYVDLMGLVGPAQRIKERWKAWADSGANTVILMRPTEEVVELMSQFA